VLICIDPGHGGPDPGAVNTVLGLFEKDLTLDISKHTAEYLRRAGIEVILTRDNDNELVPGRDDRAEMRARADVANIPNAEYLISIHVNSFWDKEVNGVEVSYWPGSVRGKALAEHILEAVHIAGGQHKRQVFEQALLLHSYGKMVTVTVEVAFISNPTDGVLLRQAAWRDKVALGIALGILTYLKTTKEV